MWRWSTAAQMNGVGAAMMKEVGAAMMKVVGARRRCRTEVAGIKGEA